MVAVDDFRARLGSPEEPVAVIGMACRLPGAADPDRFWALLRDPKVFTMAFVYFLFLGANYTLVFFTPTLIKS